MEYAEYALMYSSLVTRTSTVFVPISSHRQTAMPQEISAGHGNFSVHQNGRDLSIRMRSRSPIATLQLLLSQRIGNI